jgi:AcrR family transcriptional regulator
MKEAPENTKGAKRRTEIVAVARTLLVSEGYDRFVLREIAARVGMKLGNLQYYFATREILLEAVTRSESADDMRRLEAIAGNGAPAQAQLRDLARTLLRAWSKEGGRVYAVTLFLALHQPLFRQMQHELYQQFYAYLVPVLRKAKPGLRHSTLLGRARLITALLDGALLQLHGGAFVSKSTTRERFLDDTCEHVVSIATS